MRRILGSGLRFPMTLTPEGGFGHVSEADAVRQSIWTILSTAPGEREMRPTFGCGLYDQVFSPGEAQAAARIVRQVHDALVRWESRIEVHGVTPVVDPRVPGRLLIQIEYALRTNNSRYNLVYPLYLH